jgi:hypothetical protein
MSVFFFSETKKTNSKDRLKFNNATTLHRFDLKKRNGEKALLKGKIYQEKYNQPMCTND